MPFSKNQSIVIADKSDLQIKIKIQLITTAVVLVY